MRRSLIKTSYVLFLIVGMCAITVENFYGYDRFTSDRGNRGLTARGALRHYANPNVPFVLDAQPAQMGTRNTMELISTAFAAWNNVTTSNVNATISRTQDFTINDILGNPAPLEVNNVNEVLLVDTKAMADSLGFSQGLLGLGFVTQLTIGSGEIHEGTLYMVTAYGEGGSDYESTAVHELGHVLGLMHSPITPKSTLLDELLVPTMYPFALADDSKGRTLEPDDIAAMSEGYPEPSFASTLGVISGTVKDAQNAPLFGAVVFAMNIETGDMVSRFTGHESGLNGNGDFIMRGVPPGKYVLGVERLLTNNLGGSLLTPTRFDGFYTQADSSFIDTFLPATLGQPNAAVLNVLAGQTTTANVVVARNLSAQDDAFENNDDSNNARAVQSGSYNLNLLSGDEDWFKVNVNAGESLRILARFNTFRGDLDMQLFDPNGISVGISESSKDDEVIAYEQAPVSGEYKIRIVGFQGASNAYCLTIFGGSGAANAAVLNVTASELALSLKPGFSRSTTFQLSNSGNAVLNYNITATGLANSEAGNEATLATISMQNPLRAPHAQIAPKASSVPQVLASSAPIVLPGQSLPRAAANADVLILDDGNDTPDSFLGLNGSGDFYWRNAFRLFGYGFQLESLQFYMRTESASTNEISVSVQDANQNAIVQGNVSLGTAPGGQWYTINLPSALSFADGSTFYIEIGTPSGILFPAGADRNAQQQFASDFYDPGSGIYLPISVVNGFANGAFLIRAVGTKTGLPNQAPIARAQVSTLQAHVNETITFDGSTSSDADGQITQYLWNFGDGSTSTQAVTAHAYTQAGIYNIALTVTDDKGATGQATGQITITSGPQNRLSVNPTSGTIAPGNAQTVTVTYNAQGLAEGNYQGELLITSNGGNRTIPVRITVSNSVSVAEESSVPNSFRLEQNYPNPFNPATVIRFELPRASEVSLSIYNLSGQLVRELARGAFAGGVHQIVWEANDDRGKRVPSGVYVYRLAVHDANGQRATAIKKLTLLQ